MRVSLIAALDKNGVIGNKDNALPWYLPEDLKRFKSVTLGKPIIMGRKTFESIGKPLPERKNIVVTRNEKYEAPGCTVVHSPEEALRAAGDMPEVVVIGGGELFSQFMPRVTRMYLTLVDGEFEGNIYFPQWNPQEWRETFRESHQADGKSPYNYTFLTLEKDLTHHIFPSSL